MYRHTLSLLVVLLVSLCVAALAADFVLSVTVSPNVLILRAPTNWITIHTNLALSAVERATVEVAVDGNPLPLAAIFADSRGQMVIKIAQDEVDPYVEPPHATFVVSGYTKAGLSFEGSDTIVVKD